MKTFSQLHFWYRRYDLRRLMIRRLGTMHPASKNFIGKRWSRQREQEFVRGYFDEQKRERENSAG